MDTFSSYAPKLFRCLTGMLAFRETNPSGNWKAGYKIVEFSPNVSMYVEAIQTRDCGSLFLECRRGRDEMQLTVNHSNVAHIRDAERLYGIVNCCAGSLLSPLYWEYTHRFDKKPDPENVTGFRERCEVKQGVFYRDGRPVGAISPDYTSDYSLFAAMPMLSQQNILPQNFVMLEALTTIRRDQKLMRIGTIDLPSGRQVNEIIQTGTGIQPWFWWLDTSGFPLVCIREHHCFILQQFEVLS